MNKKSKKLKIIIVLLLYVIGSYFYNDYYMPRDLSKIYLKDLEPKEFKLTSEDYVEDFLYAYEVLKDNYPYFEINKQVHGVDWLANKDSYADYISRSLNDNDFFDKMNRILGEINNGHTNMLTRDFVIDVYTIYYTSPKNSWRHNLSKVLEKENVRRRYNLNNESLKAYVNRYYSKEEPESNLQTNNNLKIRSIIDNELAYIGIKSFANTNINFDRDLIKEALIDFQDYSNLIIDIRCNGGGNTDYWMYLLLQNVIAEPCHVMNYNFIKDGSVNKLVINKGQYKNSSVSKFLESSSFDQETKDLLKDFDYYSPSAIYLYPNNDSINYQGKIYLLVDERVYSSAEAFASFCKESGLATLVGTRTGGDGIGFDPLIFDLPNTGYAIRYSANMGVTESGSINERDQTTPDIEVEYAGREVNLPFREQKTIRAVMKDAGLEF